MSQPLAEAVSNGRQFVVLSDKPHGRGEGKVDAAPASGSPVYPKGAEFVAEPAGTGINGIGCLALTAALRAPTEVFAVADMATVQDIGRVRFAWRVMR